MNLLTKALIAVIITNAFKCIVSQSDGQTPDSCGAPGLTICHKCSEPVTDELNKARNCLSKKWKLTGDEFTNTSADAVQPNSCCYMNDTICVLTTIMKSKCELGPEYDNWVKNTTEKYLNDCRAAQLDPNIALCEPLIDSSVRECCQYQFPNCFQSVNGPKPDCTTPQSTPPKPVMGDNENAPKTTTPDNSFRALCLESVPILLCLMASLLIIF